MRKNTFTLAQLVRSTTLGPEHAPEVLRESRSISAELQRDAFVPHIALLVTNDHGEVHTYVYVTPRLHADQIVRSCEEACGARVDLLDEPPQLPRLSWHATMQRTVSTALRSTTQVGADPFEIIRELTSNGLKPGERVIVTARGAKDRETALWSRYWESITDRVTHFSLQDDAGPTTIYASATSFGRVNSLIRNVTSHMPGFDINTKPAIVHPLYGAAPSCIVTALCVALGLFAHVAVPGLSIPNATPAMLHVVSRGLLAVAVLVGVVAFCRFVFHLQYNLRLLAALRTGAVERKIVRPRLATFHVRAPRAERTVVTEQENAAPRQKTIPARAGAYPYQSNVVPLALSMVLGIVAPQGGSASGANSFRGERAVQDVQRADLGPLIGASFGAGVRYPVGSRWKSSMVFGEPGSGKTQLLRGGLFASSLMEKSFHAAFQRAMYPGACTTARTLFSAETKGGDNTIGVYLRWGVKLGQTVNILQVFDGNTQPLDIFSVPDISPKQRAELHVGNMQEAWGADSIGVKVFPTLVQAFTAAQAVDDATINYLLTNPETAQNVANVTHWSIVQIAGLILGTAGDVDIAIAGSLRAELASLEAIARTPEQELRLTLLRHCVPELAAMFPSDANSTAARRQRRDLQDNAKTKIEAMLRIPHWWMPSPFTMDELLASGANVVLNTGPPSRLVPGSDPEAFMDSNDETRRLVLAMTMSAFRKAAERRGTGVNKNPVSLYSDELAMLAPHTATSVLWIRDQGREYGVDAHYGSQRPDQLPHEVLNCVLSSGFVATFRQSDPETCRALAEALSLGGSTVTPDHINQLEQHYALVKATVNGAAQPVFGLNPFHFEQDAEMHAATDPGIDAYVPFQMGETDGDAYHYPRIHGAPVITS